MKRHVFFFAVLLASLLIPLPAAPAAHAAPRCFPAAAPAIGDCIDGRLRTFWEQQGGLPVFGYPVGAPAQEQSAAGPITVQRFERERLELHPENAPPYDVLLGRLGAEALERQGRDWQAFPKADPAAPHYFAATGHAIAPQFWGYWSSHGLEIDGRPGARFDESLALFGMPLSEPQIEVNPTDGRSYLTQWFERARFEYHPEHAGTPYAVQLGLLERELNASSVMAAQQGPLEPGGFIQASGTQLTRLGQPVQLKGVNYYPRGRPWKEMWAAWDGPQVERELRLARGQLGINAVRVLLPYNVDDTDTVSQEQVTAELLGELRETAQIAGSLNMRLIVTLFDFYEEFPPPGSAEEQRNFAYLRTLLGNFVGDDRIAAWDLHNEPDHYKTWVHGDSASVLSWLGRMADEVHRITPNQLVTVGMGQYNNLWLPGPDGRRVIDYSDMVSVHIYNAGDAARQLDELRGHTAKPIMLEEFGWPTQLTCLAQDYNEDQQARVYRDTLAAAQGRVAGVFAWTLRDYDPGPTRRWDTREEHYGLYRPDDSLKPAAQALRDYAVPPLPSVVSTNLPLTTHGLNTPDGPQAPLLIPGSGHYVKGLFRRAWELLGGQGSFGLPLTEAFVLPGDIPEHNRVVQYFEAGVLELHPEAAADPSFRRLLKEVDQVKRLVVPHNLGESYAAGRVPTEGGHAVLDQFQSFYSGVQGDWRLGAPISGALTEDRNGVPTTVQYFQKGRLEWNPAAQVVEVGRLGSWAWDSQCQSAQ